MSTKTFALPHPHFWGFLYQLTSFYAYTSSFAPFRACRGRDEDHQGLRVHPSFPAMAGGPFSEDTTSLWGNPHRPQMAPDSSPLPQAVGAGAGAGLGGGWRWRDGRRGAGLESTWGWRYLVKGLAMVCISVDAECDQDCVCVSVCVRYGTGDGGVEVERG